LTPILGVTLITLGVCPSLKAEVDTPIEQAEKLYKANRREEARRILLNTFRNVSAYHGGVAGKAEASARDLGVAIGDITSWAIRALEWEDKAAAGGDATDAKLRILRAARDATEPLLGAIRQVPLPDEEKVLFDKASYNLASIVRHELTILDAAKRTREADALRKRYAILLEMPRPVLKLDTPEFIRQSHARPGPLQKVDACYRTGMPEAATPVLVLGMVLPDTPASAYTPCAVTGTVLAPVFAPATSRNLPCYKTIVSAN